MEIEGEMMKLMHCSFYTVASLAYCYFFVAKLRPPTARLLLLLPVFYLFTHLPLTFSTIQLRGISAFFLTWLANFKLLLFSFHHGPLVALHHLDHTTSPPSFLRFLCLASLPVKDVSSASSPPSQSNTDKPLIIRRRRLDQTLAVRTLLLGIIISVYRYKHHLPHYALLTIYCLHIYLSLEIILAAAAALARVLIRLELEPQFRDPFLSISLQDFWGRRWNLMVTSILRPTVYHPVRIWAGPVLGPRPAQLLAIFAVFAVSGLMHELVFYYITLVHPTWEVTCFFLLHGVATAAEVVAKKAVPPRRLPPALVSGLATQAFVAVTGFWLFFPPLIRTETDVKAMNEYRIMIDFVRNAYNHINIRHLFN